MRLTEVTGAPPNPNCMHCALFPQVAQFIDEHPDYRSGIQAPVDLAKMTGELIASGLYNSGKRDQLDAMLAIVLREARAAALELFTTLDRNRRG